MVVVVGARSESSTTEVVEERETISFNRQQLFHQVRMKPI